MGCEEMPKGDKAKMMVLKDLLAQMQKLMSKGQGDEPMEAPELEGGPEEDELVEKMGPLGSYGDDDEMPLEPKKKKVSMMVVASGKPPMAKMNKGGKRYG